MSEFESKSDALQHLREGIEGKVFKNCFHLTVGKGSGPHEVVPFIAECQQQSFYKFPTLQFTEHCPPKCLLFLDKIEELARLKKEEQQKKRIAMLKTAVGALPSWFAKLPTLSQALILFLLVIVFFPRLAGSIITIIKALK